MTKKDSIISEIRVLARRAGLSAPRVFTVETRPRESFFSPSPVDFDDVSYAGFVGVELGFDYDRFFLSRNPRPLSLRAVARVAATAHLAVAGDDPDAQTAALASAAAMVFSQKYFSRPCALSAGDMELLYGDLFHAAAAWGIRGLHIDQLYFHPAQWDPAAAVRCGLIPFHFRGRKLLATGTRIHNEGQIRLDTYQALVSGTVDRDSLYAEEAPKVDVLVDAVGASAAGEALAAIARAQPLVELDLRV